MIRVKISGFFSGVFGVFGVFWGFVLTVFEIFEILCGGSEKCVKLTRFHVMCRHFKSFYGDIGCGDTGEFHAQTWMSIVKVNNKKKC